MFWDVFGDTSKKQVEIFNKNKNENNSTCFLEVSPKTKTAPESSLIILIFQ